MDGKAVDARQKPRPDDERPDHRHRKTDHREHHRPRAQRIARRGHRDRMEQGRTRQPRSEEHTSELQSLMRISYAVFCLKKKKNKKTNTHTVYDTPHAYTTTSTTNTTTTQNSCTQHH